MPVFNEAESVGRVLNLVLEQRPVAEVVVVDDASRDASYETLQEIARRQPRVKLIRQPTNQGKGAALRTGFQQATAPYVIVQDADFEYRPLRVLPGAQPVARGQG